MLYWSKLKKHMERNFSTLLRHSWDNQKFLCIGLDPVIEKIPKILHKKTLVDTLVSFCCHVVDTTHHYTAAFKPNLAFFEQYGSEGWQALKKICQHIHTTAPETSIILDAKRGDIGHTNEAYVTALFSYLKGDAVTLHPYLGKQSLKPFLTQKNKGCIFLIKTSNPGSVEFQNILYNESPLWLHIAKTIMTEWNNNNNCSLVLGATYPEDIASARHTLGDSTPFLIPGIGTQGGNMQTVVTAAKNTKNQGALFSVSRSIIYNNKKHTPEQSIEERAKTMSTMIKEYINHQKTTPTPRSPKKKDV